MEMKKIRIREDNYIDDKYEGYHCQECDTKFKDKDVILEIDLYESCWRFCSEKCLTEWIMDDVEKKQIEIYPMPDLVKQKKELTDRIEGMEPNTSITIDTFKVEYHKTKGLNEHYLVIGTLVRMFQYKHEVVNYILEQM